MNFSQKHLLEKLNKKRKEREIETQENYANDTKNIRELSWMSHSFSFLQFFVR